MACNNSFYLLDLMFESINASLVDYFIVFILGSVFATLRILSVRNNCKQDYESDSISYAY